MRTFENKNILRDKTLVFEFENAYKDGTVFHIGEGGGSFSVRLDTDDQFNEMTDYMRLKVKVDPVSDMYSPTVYATLSVDIPDSEQHIEHLCILSSEPEYSAELEMTRAKCENLIFKLTATESAIITVLDLRFMVSDDYSSIIDGVEQSLPRVLADYNTLPITIAQHEKTIARITCMLYGDTDLQGHFLLTYDASEACTITLRFKDGDTTELFAPVLYDVHAGRGTIGVPHAYLYRKSGAHNLIVTAQVSKGTLYVGTRNMLFTIDGGYLAQRLLDMGIAANDITCEHTTESTLPDYIWVIGVESGIALVRKSRYGAYNADFTPVYDLGEALDAAIEFDGDWRVDMSNTEATYSLYTYEVPYCFLLVDDTARKLVVQLGDDIATRVTLATGVSSMSVVRGYKSMYYPEQDDGTVYYRQYIYDLDTGTYGWNSPTQLTGFSGEASGIHVFRLNDYRVGFAVTTATQNFIYITERTYIGQAAKSEVVDTALRATANLAVFNGVPPIIAVTGGLSTDGLTIHVTFNSIVRYTGDKGSSGTGILSSVTLPSSVLSLVRGVTLEDVVDSAGSYTVLHIQLNSSLKVVCDISINPWPMWQYMYQGQWANFTYTLSCTVDPRINIYAELEEATSIALQHNTANLAYRALVSKELSVPMDFTLSNASAAELMISDVVDIYGQNSNIVAIPVEASATGTAQLIGEYPI